MGQRDKGSTGPAKTSKSAGQPSSGSRSHLDAHEAAGLGLALAMSIALFALGGNWLDGRLGTSPLFVLLGVFLGFGGGFYRMYARLVLENRDDKHGSD